MTRTLRCERAWLFLIYSIYNFRLGLAMLHARKDRGEYLKSNPYWKILSQDTNVEKIASDGVGIIFLNIVASLNR
jgi:hypothetical protein